MRTTAAVAALLAALFAGSPAVRAADTDALAADVARMVLPQGNYERLLTAVEAQTRQMLSQMLQKVKPAGMDEKKAASMMEALSPVLGDEEAKLLRRLMPTYEEMSDLQAQLLAKHYTPDELRELREFYRTPVGQKAIRIMPEVTRDAMAWMQSRMMERMPGATADFQAAIEAKVKEYAKAHGE